MIANLVKRGQVLVAENSAAILTGTGIVGTVTTAVLAGRAGFKSYALILERQLDANAAAAEEDSGAEEAELSTFQKVKIVWPLYVPPVASGITTIGSIFFSHRISASKSASLVAAYGLSEKAFQEYKTKVIEKLGDKKEDALRDEIAQDRVTANPPQETQIIMVAGGDVVCYDSHNGRYFKSSMEALKQAENEINKEILQDGYASLSSFYDKIGLDSTEYSNNVGWNLNNLLDVKYSTAMTPDNKPCIVMDFRIEPIPQYDRLYD